MNGFSGSVAPAGAMYVRALYDYDADDRTSLSFRQGDVIQVITQLESGWWDGVINGVRGWFPSNYCAIVQRPGDDGDPQPLIGEDAETGSIGGTEYTNSDSESVNGHDTAQLPIEALDRDQEEAAFWIPQATPDGRLFYFNTLTGVSTMELPLETPPANESGPRDRTNVYMPESSRPPAEYLAGGYNVEDTDDDNPSDVDGAMAASSHGSLVRPFRASCEHVLTRQPRARLNGITPATSMDSMHAVTPPPPHGANGHAPQPAQYAMTSLGALTGPPLAPATASRRFYDDANPVPLTWNRMLEDMRRATERYRQAMHNSDRCEFVKRAEDISDHLRLLLAAGSGTTDNHSGNPSIISTNKALYPHFRETMSRFSKLVLSSHIAATDFPPPDSFSKCLKEADGVLHGVYNFVEVARQQRGEDVPRLVPGFVVGSSSGGSWHNNGVTARDSAAMSFIDQEDYEPFIEPTTRLDASLLERLEGLKRLIVSGIRRLDEQLVVREKMMTPYRHQILGDNVCNAAVKLLDVCRSWMSTVESINLAPLVAAQLGDFAMLKQHIYDLVSELVVACQGVAAPLPDEWADTRDALEDRVSTARAVSRELEEKLVCHYGLLQQRSEMQLPDTGGRRNTDTDMLANPRRAPENGRPPLKDMTFSKSYSEGTALDEPRSEQLRNKKIEKFFGEVPVIPNNTVDEVPEFLKLDHEGEISYDHKANPPPIRGGTLTGLVEQLTRHDRLDPAFNNTFLLTYRSFTTASELFEMLVKRWSIQPPFGVSKDDYQQWVDKKQKPIRFRVVNILKSWFDNYWMEGNDEDARVLIQRVYNFAKDHVATTSTPGATPLMSSVEQRSRGADQPTKRLVLTLNTQTPQPILPKHMKKLKFLDIDPTEFARQLTIIESRLYGKIRPTECLNKTWQKKLGPGDADPASNVKALILHSNQLTNWVAHMILAQQEVRRRVVVIKHFVNVADVGRSCSCPWRGGSLMVPEMPCAQQLLHAHFHHLGAGHGAHPPPEPHLGCGECAVHDDAREHAHAHGRPQELCRVPRHAASREPAVHPVLWYVAHSGAAARAALTSRRLSDGPHLHRGRHPVVDQEDGSDQLRQAGQDGRGDPRHPAVPERAVPAAAGAGDAGLHSDQHAVGGRRARNVRPEPGGGAARARGREDRQVGSTRARHGTRLTDRLLSESGFL